VLAGGLVGDLGELPDQLLEGKAHVMVADGRGVEVEAGEPLRHLVEEACLLQPVGLLGEAEPLEDIADRRGEALDVGRKIRADVILIAHETREVERCGVREGHAGYAREEGLGVEALGLTFCLLREDLRLGRRQHAIEAAQHGEGQDDAAVFGRLVVASQQISDGPNEGGEGSVAHEAGSIGTPGASRRTPERFV